MAEGTRAFVMDLSVMATKLSRRSAKLEFAGDDL